jgi:hypothetical protein
MVAGDNDLNVNEKGFLIRDKNGLIMINILTFTITNILDKRSSPFKVKYEYELEPL